jgi:hypothetical protein
MVASIADSHAGLIEFGATVLNHQGAPMASYSETSFYQAREDGNTVVPCLIAVEELDEQEGWQSGANLGGAPLLEFVLEHYMLCFTVADNPDFVVVSAHIRTMTVNYYTALNARPYLRLPSNPATHYAPSVRHKKIKSVWAESEYHSVLFQLLLKLNL